jgi:hypothetical protein
MYRLAFIAKHGMRSYKANLAPPVPGARVERPQYGHHFSVGLLGAAFLVPFGAVAKRDSRTYSVLTTKQ